MHHHQGELVPGYSRAGFVSRAASNDALAWVSDSAIERYHARSSPRIGPTATAWCYFVPNTSARSVQISSICTHRLFFQEPDIVTDIRTDLDSTVAQLPITTVTRHDPRGWLAQRVPGMVTTSEGLVTIPLSMPCCDARSWRNLPVRTCCRSFACIGLRRCCELLPVRRGSRLAPSGWHLVYRSTRSGCRRSRRVKSKVAGGSMIITPCI